MTTNGSTRLLTEESPAARSVRALADGVETPSQVGS